jgi:hypothetical protein
MLQKPFQVAPHGHFLSVAVLSDLAGMASPTAILWPSFVRQRIYTAVPVSPVQQMRGCGDHVLTVRAAIATVVAARCVVSLVETGNRNGLPAILTELLEF